MNLTRERLKHEAQNAHRDAEYLAKKRTLWALILGTQHRVDEVLYYQEVKLNVVHNSGDSVPERFRMAKVRTSQGYVHLIDARDLSIRYGYSSRG